MCLVATCHGLTRPELSNLAANPLVLIGISPTVTLCTPPSDMICPSQLCHKIKVSFGVPLTWAQKF
ncbi:hypothetical protein CPAR01_10278 [Colletotrichum paranaense]|uniref:Uncharacterized protein n=1 Tax=Colletotrichum paranaense TaxID=1914294 RepID=A0ABQ9SE83_9PEZI|nr:uncharacterized protein CPAR01_10278 [Colletotrichum paranaense]KAK1533570.1 hypothetical protein CPAR01_10278 [Colletotrichum paranaense]